MKNFNFKRRIAEWLLCLAIALIAVNLPSFSMQAHANDKDVLLFSGEGELTHDEVLKQAQENIGKKIARIEGYSSIGVDAFDGQKFEIVIIGDSVNAIHDGAFEHIGNCKYIVLPNSLSYIEGMTAFCGARCIVYSGYLADANNWGSPKRCDKVVDDFCLSSDGRLLSGYVGDSTSITIPCGVDSIDDGAFAKSYLQEIVIPAYVEFLGDGLFKECFKLDCVKFEDISNLSWNINSFMDTPNNVCFDIEKTDDVSKIESLYDLIVSDTDCGVRVHPMYYDEVSETCNVDKLPLPEPLPDELFEYDLDSDMYVLTVNDENKAAIAKYKDIRILANHKLIVDTDLEISGDLYVDFFGAITVNKGCSVRAFYVDLSDIVSVTLGDKDSLSGLGIDAADVRVKHTGDPELYVLDPDDIDDTEFMKENGLLVYKDGPDCGINMNSDGTCVSEDGETKYGDVYFEVYTNPDDAVPAYTGLLEEDWATVDMEPAKFKAGSRIDFIVKAYNGKVLQTNGVRFPDNKTYISTREEELKADLAEGCRCSYVLPEDPDRYLGVTVHFVNPDELLTDATFAWSYDERVQQYDFDTYVSHGVIEVVSAYNDGEPLFNSHNPDIAPYWSEPGENVTMSDEEGNRWFEQQGRFPIGTELIVRLIPDRGYQLTKFTISNIESSTTAVDGVNEYTFNLSRPDYYHLCAVFTPVEDEVDVTEASDITGASITYAEDEIDNGTMSFVVSDTTPSEADMAQFECMAEINGCEITKCMSLESEQLFYKAVENPTREQCWVIDKSELNGTSTITLDIDGLNPEDIFVVHKHNDLYEGIPATYENGQLTFRTQSFSDFAIATKKAVIEDGLQYSPEDNCWYLYKNGAIDYDYNGLYYDLNYGWWLIQNGMIDFTYTDLYYDANIGWWKVNNGQLDLAYDDLYCSPTLGWWKVSDGALDLGYTDLYCSPTYGWWKVNNGQLDLAYSDLYYSPTIGWWKIEGGALNLAYTDLYCSPTLGWWKVSGGALDLSYTDMYCSPTLGWWKVNNGQLDFTYTDLYYSPTIGWWKINNGQLDTGYTDLYCSPTLGWWKVSGGALDLAYTDFYFSPTIGWWKVNGGALDLSYYGLYCSPTLGWWKVISGTIDFGFTGVYNDAVVGSWYINNGQLDTSFNGYVTTDGITYLVTNGHAEPVSYGTKSEELTDSDMSEIEPAKPVIDGPEIAEPDEPDNPIIDEPGSDEPSEPAEDEPDNPMIDGDDEPETESELMDA